MDIFISYRRQDTSGYALALRRELTRSLPDSKVFLDVESLDAGERWKDVVCDRVGSCDLVLVVIGDEWLVTRDGHKKIDREEDPVRFELVTALGRENMTIMPVLVEEARMPAPADLPADVRALCERHAHQIHDRTYDQDVNALVELLTRRSAESTPHLPPADDNVTSPPVADAQFPSRITYGWLEYEVPSMGRDQLLALIAELIGRGWLADEVYESAIAGSPLKPPKRLPARVTVGWLAQNVPLLSPTRVDKLIKELKRRNWSDSDIRIHVLGNRQPGLAPDIPSRIQTSWVLRWAPLMTVDERDALAAALIQRGWTSDEAAEYVPYAQPAC